MHPVNPHLGWVTGGRRTRIASNDIDDVVGVIYCDLAFPPSTEIHPLHRKRVGVPCVLATVAVDVGVDGGGDGPNIKSVADFVPAC